MSPVRGLARCFGPWATIVLALALLLACGAPPPPTAPAVAATEPALVAQASTATPTLAPSATAAPAPTEMATPQPTATAAVTPLPPATATPLAAMPTATPAVAARGEGGVPGPAAPTPPAVLPTLPAHPGQRVVCLDPGHGGPEVGAANGDMAEKDINLAIALKAADLLRAAGVEPVLTRDSDRAVDPRYTGNSYRGGLTDDVQARIDICNAAGADLFFSIHNNGSGDPGQSGSEVWYNVQRTFSDRNTALADLLLRNILNRLRALGYPAVDRGTKEDTTFRIFQGRPYNLYVLGPGVGARPHVPTLMPGCLGESLFLSNPSDVAMLSRESTLDAIAGAYRDAALAYFQQFPE